MRRRLRPSPRFLILASHADAASAPHADRIRSGGWDSEMPATEDRVLDLPSLARLCTIWLDMLLADLARPLASAAPLASAIGGTILKLGKRWACGARGG